MLLAVILSVIVAIVLNAFLPYYKYHHHYYNKYRQAPLKKDPNSILRAKLCFDLDIVLKIANFEFYLARLELKKTDLKQFSIRDSVDNYFTCNSSIHQSIYGHVTLSRLHQHKGIKFLRYFILRKNANTYIRSILNHFQVFGEDLLSNQKLAMSVTPRIRNLQLNPNGSVSSIDAAINPSIANSTFSFTFVRDPISRFISGYTEVEYRWQTDSRLARFNSTGAKDSPSFFHKNSALGSVQRVKDFIVMLLLSNGSKCSSVFNNSADDFNDATLNHIAPMISTLIWARKSSPPRLPLKLYKLEHFNHEWERLARDSTFQSLIKTRFSTPLKTHGSSDDPFKTSKAAKLLLFSAEGVASNSRNPNVQYPNRMSSLITLVKELPYYLFTQFHRKMDDALLVSEKNIYLRVLCRLYVADFICAGYSFPAACKDIYDELPDLILKAQLL